MVLRLIWQRVRFATHGIAAKPTMLSPSRTLGTTRMGIARAVPQRSMVVHTHRCKSGCQVQVANGDCEWFGHSRCRSWHKVMSILIVCVVLDSIASFLYIMVSKVLEKSSKMNLRMFVPTLYACLCPAPSALNVLSGNAPASVPGLHFPWQAFRFYCCEVLNAARAQCSMSMP
jgi:hypothetical protein